MDLTYNYLNRKDNNVLQKKEEQKNNILNKIKTNVKSKLENIESDILKNKIISGLFNVFITLVIVSFILYIFLEGEKPGWLVIQNNYLMYLITILPMILLGFSYNYFHYYIQQNVTSHLQKFIYNIYFSKNLNYNSINNENDKKEDYQSIIMVESILFTTLILATSMIFSKLSKLILEKGIINYKDYQNKSKNNLLFNFFGIIIGGVIYMIYYFLFNNNQNNINTFSI